MNERSRSAVILGSYALLALTVFPVFPHFVSPNELSRWLTAASLVEHGTFEVSELAPLVGPRFEDLSERDGRIYSNKAPGLALVSLPAYGLVASFLGDASGQTLRPTVTAMRLVASTLPLLLLAVLMRAAVLRIAPSDAEVPFGLFVLLFGTPLFSYGLLLFSHALAAATIFSAWLLLLVFPERTAKRELGAGALLGLAVLSEYPGAGAAAILLALLLWERRFASVGRVLAGALPFALMFAAHNWVAFGSPFALSYAGFDRFEQFREQSQHGIFGVGLPSPVAIGQILLGPQKGIFLFSPILLAGILAFAAARRSLSRAAFAGLCAVPIFMILIASGYWYWHGGWGVASRHVVVAIPFLVFPLFLRRNGLVSVALAGLSVFANVLAGIVFPFIPNGAFPIPWATFSLPLLGQGLIAPNAFHFIGRTMAIVVPLLLAAIAAAASLAGRRLAALAGGVLVATGLAVGLETMRAANLREVLQRAYIEEVYFEQNGAMARLQIPLPARLVARRDLELGLPPPSWPF